MEGQSGLSTKPENSLLYSMQGNKPKNTVGSQLSELQLFEHVGYLNQRAFSKTTAINLATFVDGKLFRWQISVLTLPLARQLKTHDNLQGQGRLLKKCNSNCQNQPLGTASLPHARSGNGNRATAYSCDHSSDCYIYSVQKFFFQTCTVRRCIARRWQRHVSSSVLVLQLTPPFQVHFFSFNAVLSI